MGRGGNREGAGRPLKDSSGRRMNKSISLPPRIISRIDREFGGDNFSAKVEKALTQKIAERSYDRGRRSKMPKAFRPLFKYFTSVFDSLFQINWVQNPICNITDPQQKQILLANLLDAYQEPGDSHGLLHGYREAELGLSKAAITLPLAVFNTWLILVLVQEYYGKDFSTHPSKNVENRSSEYNPDCYISDFVTDLAAPALQFFERYLHNTAAQLMLVKSGVRFWSLEESDNLSEDFFCREMKNWLLKYFSHTDPGELPEGFRYLRVCRNCGKIFELSRKTRLHCSEGCRSSFRRSKEKLGLKTKGKSIHHTLTNVLAEAQVDFPGVPRELLCFRIIEVWANQPEEEEA